MNTQSYNLRIISLAWPILVGQLALIANGAIDTIMVSRFAALDLAALSLGVSIYISIFVGLSGVLQALLPFISQLYGAQQFQKIGYKIKQGLWLVFFLSCIGCILLLIAPVFLSIAHPSFELAKQATYYLHIEALALPAALGFRIYAVLNIALTKPKMVMAIQIIALILKVPLNILLIFGGFGLPAFGGAGSAIATSLISWLMLVTCWFLMRTLPMYRKLCIFRHGFVKPQWQTQCDLLKLGLPIGMSYFIEVTAFALMAVFITRLGTTVVAGHQIIANVSTILYMLPLSLANATGTLVAQAIGSRNWSSAQKITWTGIRLSIMLSVLVGIIVWFAREYVIRIYTPDQLIIASALPLFLFISFYQLFDSLQVTVSFILRAYKVVIMPTLIYAITLWGVGLSSGYILGLNPFGFSPSCLYGAAGFWLGNSISLGLVAIFLLYYLQIIQRRACCKFNFKIYPK